MSIFPPSAEPVVAVLRREVRKPEVPALCKFDGSTTLPRWTHHDTDRGTPFEECWVCAMGLHKRSISQRPRLWQQFAGGVCQQAAVTAFMRGWDSLPQEMVPAAIEEIWG